MANILFALLIVLILGALYIMKGGDNPPETGYDQTPERAKALLQQKETARQTADQMQQALQQSSEKSDEILKSIKDQR